MTVGRRVEACEGQVQVEEQLPCLSSGLDLFSCFHPGHQRDLQEKPDGSEKVCDGEIPQRYHGGPSDL